MTRSSRDQSMTEEDFLNMEEHSNVRYEFVDGHVFAMTGSTEAHNLICMNLFRAIDAKLDGSPCRAYCKDMKVKIKAAKSFYYPDIIVTCEPFDAKSVFKTAPVLVVEVLSPSTGAIDQREKLVAYKKIPSLSQYLIVYQDMQKTELWTRSSDNEWQHSLSILDEDIVLESLPNGPLSISLSTIYKGYNPPDRVKEQEEVYEFEIH